MGGLLWVLPITIDPPFWNALMFVIKRKTCHTWNFQNNLVIFPFTFKCNILKGSKFYFSNFVLLPFSSLPDGNCLFSSVSLLLNGTNDLVHDLRILTAIELFENCKEYCDHTIFSQIYHEKRNKRKRFTDDNSGLTIGQWFLTLILQNKL